MSKRIYIETTIPSFYFEQRTEPSMVARREWTREWWQFANLRNEMVTSEAVIEELFRGNFPARDDCLKLIKDLPLLTVERTIANIVQSYISLQAMPQDPAGDALHLALASYYRCDFLVTWNCKHLANANKFHHIKHVNDSLGIHYPILVTPLELLGDENEN